MSVSEFLQDGFRGTAILYEEDDKDGGPVGGTAFLAVGVSMGSFHCSVDAIHNGKRVTIDAYFNVVGEKITISVTQDCVTLKEFSLWPPPENDEREATP